MICHAVFFLLLDIRHSAATAVSEELSDSLQVLQTLLLDSKPSHKETPSSSSSENGEEKPVPVAGNQLFRGGEKGRVAVDAKGKYGVANTSLMQRFASKDRGGSNAVPNPGPLQGSSRNQGFIDELKAEIESLTSQLTKAEGLPKSTSNSTSTSNDAERAKQANKSKAAALFRGKGSSKKAKSKGRSYPLEPSGVLNSNTSGGHEMEVEGECAPGNAWWGRRLPQEPGFWMPSCESRGWKTVTTWCECKVAAEHVGILDKRIYAINASCDGASGCPQEPAGCYVKDGTVFFNPPQIWNVQSCATWTDWETTPNRGCLCEGQPTTTTTTTTPHCTDFSGYYRNKIEQVVAIQQDGCALTCTFQGTTWANGTALQGGWHLISPSGPDVVQGTAGPDSIMVQGTIGRGLGIAENPNGTNHDGTVKEDFPFGKSVIEWDNSDKWTRTTCNIFNGTYSDGSHDYEIMQSGCSVNVSMSVLEEDAMGYYYHHDSNVIGNVTGNILSLGSLGMLGRLDQKLMMIKWQHGHPWSRGTLALHSGRSIPPPE